MHIDHRSQVFREADLVYVERSDGRFDIVKHRHAARAEGVSGEHVEREIARLGPYSRVLRLKPRGRA